MNHIFLNRKRLQKIEKIGRDNIYSLSDRTKIYSYQITLVEVECPDCKQKRRLAKLNYYNLHKSALCKYCKSKGERNHQFGKKHSKETKKRISNANKGRLIGSKNPMYGISTYEYLVKKYGKIKANKLEKNRRKKLREVALGKNNHFYGKKHTKDSIEKIIEANKKYRDSLTEKEKIELSKQQSKIQKAIYNKNPQDYINKRRRAGQIAAEKSIKYKINKLETKIQNKLVELGLDFEYSVIIGYRQFDFGSREHRILLEVNGDYWHGNPKLYKKSDLNNIQINNKKKDKEKKKFAQKHNMKLYYIWEQDVKNNNFTVLEDIKNEILSRRN
jgi:very-short-patch-repair endonuclease